jgi:hypothetical protein
MQCENLYDNEGCQGQAIEQRDDFRFGKDGEQAVVSIVIHLCENCAAIYDDIQDEGRAEAAAS